MSKWVDYSFARPDLAQMKKDGVVGVLRYLAPNDQLGTSGKILSAAEKDALLAAGFDIALNFEWYEGRCNQGSMAGVQDAAVALREAKALGYPKGKTIYFSHDTGVYDWQAIDAYFRAVKDGFAGYYKVGAYGSCDLITHLHSAGLIDYGWQTLAWSNGKRDPWAVIYQDGLQLYGGSADVDEVTSTDIGSWKDGPSVEDDMFEPTDRSMLSQIFDQLPKLPQALLTEQQSQSILNSVSRVVSDLDVRIATLQSQVDKLSTGGGQLDLSALARAVADELAKRMES